MSIKPTYEELEQRVIEFWAKMKSISIRGQNTGSIKAVSLEP